MMQPKSGRVGGMILRIVYFTTLAFLLFLALLAIFFKTVGGSVGNEWGEKELLLFAAQVVTPFAAIFLGVNLFCLLVDSVKWPVYLVVSGLLCAYCYFGYCVWRPIPPSFCACDPSRIINERKGNVEVTCSIYRCDGSIVYASLEAANLSNDSVSFNFWDYYLMLHHAQSSELNVYSVAHFIPAATRLGPNEKRSKDVYWAFELPVDSMAVRDLQLISIP